MTYSTTTPLIEEVLSNYIRNIIPILIKQQCYDNNLWASCVNNCQKGLLMFWQEAEHQIKQIIRAYVNKLSPDDIITLWFECEQGEFYLNECFNNEITYSFLSRVDKVDAVVEYLNLVIQSIAADWPDHYLLNEIKSGNVSEVECAETTHINICDFLDLWERGYD